MPPLPLAALLLLALEEEEDHHDSSPPAAVVNDPSTYLALRTTTGAGTSSSSGSGHHHHDHQDEEQQLSIIYSYEVEWVKSPAPGGQEQELKYGRRSHYFATFIYLVTVVCLLTTAIIATIMIRSLRRDMASAAPGPRRASCKKKKQTIQTLLDDQAPQQEEAGWKLVCRDVFRAPQHIMILSALVGIGAQIAVAFLLCCFVTTCAKIGLFLKKNHHQVVVIKNEEILSTALLIINAILVGPGSSVASGYVSARIFKFCEDTISSRSSSTSRVEGTDNRLTKQRTKLLVVTTLGLPGVLFLTMFIILMLNLLILSFVGEVSAAAAAPPANLWSVLALFAVWTCFSVPFVFVGGFLGFRAEKIAAPTETNQIARHIPKQNELLYSWCFTPPFSFLLIGLLPFGSICVEQIMSAIWLHDHSLHDPHPLSELLVFAASLIISGVTCAEVAIAMCYLHLVLKITNGGGSLSGTVQVRDSI